MTVQMRIRAGLILGAVIIAGGVAALHYFQRETAAPAAVTQPPKAVPVTVAPVVEKAAPVEVNTVGRVQTLASVAVRSRIDGVISAVSVTDLTTSSGNLLTNGDFSGGVYTSAGNSGTPNGWIYANIYGATDGGTIETGCGFGGGNCWSDGAVQAYDALSQSIATTIGDNYRISFHFNGGGCDDAACLYSDLSTNGNVTGTGGNGIDMLVYAEAGLPIAGGVPEPATWIMFLLGFGAVGWTLRSRGSRMASTA